MKCKNAEHVACYGATEHRIICKTLSEQAFCVGERRTESVYYIYIYICSKQEKERNLKIKSEILGSISCLKWNCCVPEITSFLPLEIPYTTLQNSNNKHVFQYWSLNKVMESPLLKQIMHSLSYSNLSRYKILPSALRW